MKRTITGYHLDEEQDWVADLDCGHGQHVRHKPPFFNRPWTVTEEGRQSRIGAVLNCTRCDELEWPTQFDEYHRTPVFDQSSVPQALQRHHQTKAGIWARIHVLEGRLTYTIDPPIDHTFILDPTQQGIVVPQVPHFVTPEDGVRFFVAFHKRTP